MWEMNRMDERRYSVPSIATPMERPISRQELASEDLHAWSIYRQNLNSDFADSALGSGEKSPLPYGNFQLRESTVRSILSHPRYGPRSELGGNMYTYLKFGLPRVFPPGMNPRGSNHTTSSNNQISTPAPTPQQQPRHHHNRDGSSGYDSSDDGSPKAQTRSGYLRSKSEQALNIQHHYQQQQHQISNNKKKPNRSSSEANLLTVSSGLTASQRASSQQYLSTITNNYDLRVPSQIKLNGHTKQQQQRRRSSSNIYMAYPHLQLRAIDLQGKNKKQIILEQINLEARGGDMLGIMATSESEGTALLEVLSGRRRVTRGEIWLNGHNIRASMLKRHVSVVDSLSESFDPNMSTRQTLRFHSWLNATPASSKVRKAEVEALLSELGLTQVRDTRVGSLTQSEKVRLHVACSLLQGCDLLALDGPTRQMDIFDTFFLLEFLRQWSTAAPRIVILALHPPTFEIFCMLSRVALLASGRLTYAGRRKDMLPYFARIEYPCPAFKNPSDYYLDLVTLDDLSAEAMLESSQRIQQLGEVFVRRQSPLTDPGPPIELPPRAATANPFRQASAIFLRAIALHCPLGMVRFSRILLLSAALSVCLGAIFWDMRTPNAAQHSLTDWMSFHIVVMAVASIPLVLWAAEPADREQKAVSRDVNDGLYSRGLYYICKLLMELPVLICIGLAYFAPVYAMSGSTGGDIAIMFLRFLSLMLLYWFASHSVLLFWLAALKSRLAGSIMAVSINWLLLICAGYPLHQDDLSPFISWLQWASPARWLLYPLSYPELSSVSSVTCKAVQVQRQDIIVQLPCALSRGEDALRPYLLTSYFPWNDDLYISAAVTAIISCVWTFLAFLAWIIRK